MSAQQPSEEEIRAALEEEMRRVRVEDVVLQTVVSLVNLGARRAGVAPELEAERDLDQVRVAVEAVRALMPLVEQMAPQQAAPIRDALSQLQLAYVRAGGTGEAPAEGAPSPPGPEPGPQAPEGAGPAQQSGRLWIPGQ